MKLKTRIQTFSTVFLLLLIVIVNTSIYLMFYKLSTNRELEQLALHTNAIEEALQKSEAAGVPSADLLAAYVPSDGMVRIITADEHYVHQYTKKSSYTTLDGSFSQTEKRYLDHHTDIAATAVISRPVIWENGKVVTLQVSKFLTTLQADMRLLLYVLLLASLFVILPSTIASGALSNFLLRPIKELIATMRENTETHEWKKIVMDEKRPKDELYEMEVTFNELIETLAKTFQKQEEFVSDASHELKTPLAIIKGYIQLMERRGTDHPELLEEAVTAIHGETDRMQLLIEQMLLLAKNEPNVKREQIDFTNVCEQVRKSFQGVTERTIHADVEPISVLANEEGLQQVLYILIDNALKYSEKDINVALTYRDGDAVLSVKDEGEGISEEDQKRIFDRFYRVDKARSRESGGTGLGLAIAKTITEAHGGTLTVSSAVGKGTTFQAVFPYATRGGEGDA